jgi:hypothetical protein
MRFYISLPAPLVDRLRDQAQKAHRPPRHHAEWLLMQALCGQPDQREKVEVSDEEVAVTEIDSE